MNITIVGIGYVGMALATMFSQKNNVVALDIDSKKIDLVNKRKSPIKDKEIEKALKNKKLSLIATSDKRIAYKNPDYIFIATPTNYDKKIKGFNTDSIKSVIKDIMKYCPDSTVIIKSTVPVGFTENIKKIFKKNNIIFSPEFLREGKALYDNLFPSRIVIGSKDKIGKKLGSLIKKHSLNKNVEIIYTGNNEAEAIKLFSNTFLALRISYFNELDTYASKKKLNSLDIIRGVCLDSRIGNYYNNPSFGYGGYCLPKDTKQLLTNYDGIPQSIIKAIIKSNETRKLFIAKEITDCKPKIVGVYKLSMKKESDNYRSSAIIDIIKILKNNKIKVIIYEPIIQSDTVFGCKLINDLPSFKKKSSIIIANRYSNKLKDVKYKLYTKDLFNNN